MVTAEDEERWEAKKRDLLHMFGSILKTSALNGKIETQTTLVALDQVVGMAPVGGPIDLTPFDAFLAEHVADMGSINEALVFFEHRAEKISVTLFLPERLRDMDASEREGILSDWSGASQAVTYALKDTPAPVAEKKPPTTSYKKKEARRGPHPAFIVMVFVAIAGLGGSLYYQKAMEGPRARRDVVLPLDSAALRCVETLAVDTRLSCKVGQAAWEKYSPAEREVRIEETKRHAVTAGFSKLMIIVKETGQFVGSY